MLVRGRIVWQERGLLRRPRPMRTRQQVLLAGRPDLTVYRSSRLLHRPLRQWRVRRVSSRRAARLQIQQRLLQWSLRPINRHMLRDVWLDVRRADRCRLLRWSDLWAREHLLHPDWPDMPAEQRMLRWQLLRGHLLPPGGRHLRNDVRLLYGRLRWRPVLFPVGWRLHAELRLLRGDVRRNRTLLVRWVARLCRWLLHKRRLRLPARSDLLQPRLLRRWRDDV